VIKVDFSQSREKTDFFLSNITTNFCKAKFQIPGNGVLASKQPITEANQVLK